MRFSALDISGSRLFLKHRSHSGVLSQPPLKEPSCPCNWFNASFKDGVYVSSTAQTRYFKQQPPVFTWSASPALSESLHLYHLDPGTGRGRLKRMRQGPLPGFKPCNDEIVSPTILAACCSSPQQKILIRYNQGCLGRWLFNATQTSCRRLWVQG